jgi:uncharacterized membrane protein
MSEPSLQHDFGQSSGPPAIDERQLVFGAYVLHVIGPFTAFLLTIVAVVINYLKRDETSPLVASHHRWMIRTFWWGVLWYAISLVLCLVVIGFVLVAVVTIWWIYRHVRGLLALAEQKPMPE